LLVLEEVAWLVLQGHVAARSARKQREVPRSQPQVSVSSAYTSQGQEGALHKTWPLGRLAPAMKPMSQRR